MGASGWWYEVEYQADIAKALFELQARVFEKGEFLHPWKRRRWAPPPAHLDDILAEAAAVAPGASVEELRESAKRLQIGKRPLAITHVVALAGAGGTHSILDVIMGVGNGFGRVAPLDLADYDRLFNTLVPSIRKVRSRRNELLDMGILWTARYVVAYRNGWPSKIVFTGFSGD
jgi:hypothetical protein